MNRVGDQVIVLESPEEFQWGWKSRCPKVEAAKVKIRVVAANGSTNTYSNKWVWPEAARANKLKSG